MSSNSEQNILNQLRRVIKDAIDYLQSAVTLLQARLAEMALSSAVFLVLLALASFLGIAAFIFLNIALGIWLNGVLQNPSLSVLILGIFYGLLAVIAGSIAMRWLNQLKS